MQDCACRVRFGRNANKTPLARLHPHNVLFGELFYTLFAWWCSVHSTLETADLCVYVYVQYSNARSRYSAAIFNILTNFITLVVVHIWAFSLLDWVWENIFKVNRWIWNSKSEFHWIYFKSYYTKKVYLVKIYDDVFFIWLFI